MIYAKAFAPGNISCIFSIQKKQNPENSGSKGVGFTINSGVIVKVRKINKNLKNIIYFNNKKIYFPTINCLIKKLTNETLEVKIKSKLPLGCGFGLSGASAIATSYAINHLFNLGKTNYELAKIAHISEVENGTGLGDVVNQYFGGFLIKNVPSYKFQFKKIPMNNRRIYYKVFGKLDTKSIITNEKSEKKINYAAYASLKKINLLLKKNNKNLLEKIIKISKEFALKSGLLKNKHIIEFIKKIEKDKSSATMIMLGNSMFSNKPFKGSRSAMISDKPAYLID